MGFARRDTTLSQGELLVPYHGVITTSSTHLTCGYGPHRTTFNSVTVMTVTCRIIWQPAMRVRSVAPWLAPTSQQDPSARSA